MKHRARRLARTAYRAAVVSALVVGLLLTPPAALAQRKKKDEEEAGPTKSYVLPYFLVMMLMGVGIMTVIRPNKRAPAFDEKAKKKEDEFG